MAGKLVFYYIHIETGPTFPHACLHGCRRVVTGMNLSSGQRAGRTWFLPNPSPAVCLDAEQDGHLATAKQSHYIFLEQNKLDLRSTSTFSRDDITIHCK